MSEQSKLIRRIADSIFGQDTGCSDSGCFYGHSGGMATNGGCKCIDDNPRIAARRMKKIAYELATAKVVRIMARNHQDLTDAGALLKKISEAEK